MFEKIHQYVQAHFDLSEEAQLAMVRFFESMERSNAKLERSLMQIGAKYRFEHLASLKKSPHISTNTLFFWRELFEFPLSAALDEEEIDEAFMLFIDHDDIASPLIGYIEAGLEKVCFDIYHTWVAYHFQQAKLYETGLPVGITVNSDTVSYYFNDFSYDDHSKYHHRYDTENKVGRPFNRDLTIEEIFIRTHLLRVPYRRISLSSQGEQQIESMELEGAVLRVTQRDLHSRQVLSQTEKQYAPGNSYARDVGTDIDAMITYFEAAINRGNTFDLAQCTFEA